MANTSGAAGFAYPVARSMTVPIVHMTAKPARIQATGRQSNGRLGARGWDRECGASGLWSDAIKRVRLPLLRALDLLRNGSRDSEFTWTLGLQIMPVLRAWGDR